jgi:hypothetical protein
MDKVEAAKLVMLLASLVTSNVSAAQRVAGVIQQRRADGKEVTVQDLHDVVGDDDAAKADLEREIGAAPTSGTGTAGGGTDDTSK